MKKLIAFLLVAGLASASMAAVGISRVVSKDSFAKLTLRVQAETVTVDATSTNGFATVSLATFDPGLVHVDGCVADLNFTFSTNDIALGSGLDVAIGSSAIADGGLGGTGAANLVPAIDIDPTTNAVIQAQGVATSAALVDGTSSAGSVNINVVVDDADVAAVVTGQVDGVVTVIYSVVGDY